MAKNFWHVKLSKKTVKNVALFRLVFIFVAFIAVIFSGQVFNVIAKSYMKNSFAL